MPRTTLTPGEAVKVGDSTIIYSSTDDGQIVLNVRCAEHIRVAHVKRDGRETVIGRLSTAVVVKKALDCRRA